MKTFLSSGAGEVVTTRRSTRAYLTVIRGDNFLQKSRLKHLLRRIFLAEDAVILIENVDERTVDRILAFTVAGSYGY
jgi:hypothetical protein